MLKNAMSHLHLLAGRRVPEPRPPRTVRLPVPPSLSAELGCDAVGVPARYGFRLLAHLPRAGCVFAEDEHWWWIVPAGSDLDLGWPPQTVYAKGALVPAARPRLVHRPDGRTPYTPPIPLFLMVCQVMGVTPSWAPSGVPSPSPSGGSRAVSAP
ncbi:hypothetical protein ACFU6R_20405 [Streptomyces sp. NPDC057499]|uniref:hypothetical protein n=1 Tax=Streptomyces sp. NPDC057499 TaxID=3346150 RepID=UPI0036969F53